jgi:hypothetical protein
LWDEIKYELADKLGEQLSQLKIAELFFGFFLKIGKVVQL